MKRLASVGKAWLVAPADYQFVGLVTARIEYRGQPVSTAKISLSDGIRKAEQLLDPSMQGECRFYVIKPGKVTVQVAYNSKGKPAAPVNQTFDLALSENSPEARLTIAVPDETPVNTSRAATKQPDKVAEAKDTGNPIGRIIAILFVLGAVGGLGYFLLRMAQKNPEALKAKLKDLGVSIPDAHPDPGPSAPIPVAPHPVQPISLDNSHPDPVAATPTTGLQPANPRLVSEAGQSIPVVDGTMTVGRDEGLDLSLPGESTVSRRHAQIIRDGQNVWLEDLSSTNGTFHNGVQISSKVELRHGDAIQFGAVRYRLEG
ncbi:MAG: FHA domain-containing protein [Burkholderiaceae bacterium]|nr:FHA domain-containing protein [Burkholderiaceae bacterium]